MALTFHLDVVSAEGALYGGPAEMLVAPTVDGEVGILPRHAQLLAKLKPGELRITEPGGRVQSLYVSGGILEVQPHVVTVLSDTAVRAADLDEAAAEEARRRAEAALSAQQGEIDLAKARAELAEALAQLAIIQRRRRGR